MGVCRPFWGIRGTGGGQETGGRQKVAHYAGLAAQQERSYANEPASTGGRAMRSAHFGTIGALICPLRRHYVRCSDRIGPIA